MDFKVGDKVRFLNEIGEAIIIKILSKNTVLLNSEGVEIPYPKKELVAIFKPENDPENSAKSNSDQDNLVSNLTNDQKPEFQLPDIDPLQLANAMKQKSSSRPLKVSKPNHIYDIELEVDLHIDELVESYKGMSNGQILTIQLRHCQAELENAIHNNVKKIVFIHGVGVGRLKHEIHQLLSTYDFIQFRDASFAKYGAGATEVILR